ncbi:MAG TPA: 3-methyladenine DNA glycosylase, partial [Nocardioidaceae bacterium]|nr:3-methyladenine DNA glycosylase [Nocardioidaceae bacterium]
ACSHFDAFRFFTADARPLNTLSPGRDDRPAVEQPGCLHAGMDLYKHSARLVPMVSSELVADCFELARDIRELDMRASPYDLSALGYTPVRIETVEGKQEYVAAQRMFAERGAPLRRRLIAECERLLAV